jgi:predicted site-specific integrase-resolvase
MKNFLANNYSTIIGVIVFLLITSFFRQCSLSREVSYLRYQQNKKLDFSLEDIDSILQVQTKTILELEKYYDNRELNDLENKLNESKTVK